MARDYEKKYHEVIADINTYGQERRPCLFILDFEQKRGIFVPNPMSQSDILFSINGYTNTQVASQRKDIAYSSDPISYETYLSMFETVKSGLKRGDSFLCNLTTSTPIKVNASLREIFDSTKARYKVFVPEKFVCFSPEIFITIDSKGQISSHPMKGTIDASIPEAERLILDDYKETAEHCTIVDLIRNDLNIISEKVHVEKFRYIDKIDLPNDKGLLQVSSKIVGQLPSDFHSELGTLIDRLLPAGSISGAPKRATIDIIQKAEQAPRGYYTGIVGYYDGESLDSGVLIRFIEERQDGSKHFRSGGGITINSVPKEEYHEVIQKVYIPNN